MRDKLKKIIFNKLYMNLGKAELIEYNDHIWLIDRETKYWYFEYEKSGMLWWRYQFFADFFILFSMEKEEYEPFIVSWVKDVLNCKILTTLSMASFNKQRVENVLNCKVSSTELSGNHFMGRVDEILNCKVSSTQGSLSIYTGKMDEILNCKVSSTDSILDRETFTIDEVLRISEANECCYHNDGRIEGILKNR